MRQLFVLMKQIISREQVGESAIFHCFLKYPENILMALYIKHFRKDDSTTSIKTT